MKIKKEKAASYIEYMRELGGRIKEIRETLNLTQVEFGAALNLSKGYYNQIEQGNSNPGSEFFYALTAVYHVNMEYLFHGKGKMFLEEERERVSEGGELEAVVNKEDLLWYMEHSPVLRHMVMDYTNSILKDLKDAIKRSLVWSRKLKPPEED